MASSSNSGTFSGVWVPPTAEELQHLLPQYEITSQLGRGGMGAVYKGRQITLDRPVAIKILSNALDEADASFAERFKNEARAMGRLAHAGIVGVYDFGETEGGLLYIVMEFIEGTDVAKMIAEQGRLPTAHALAITAHVCDALQFAHDRSIIHRDIKPANIMVGYDGVVKVADFGLAKMTAGGEAAGLTQSGMALGTLHYMAPEALMLGSSADHRADIYAVGVMLYQMLTGKVPHGMFELPSKQVADLDPRYDEIIAKAMKEDRELRYQQIGELRRDLDGILTQPVVKVEEHAEKAPAALPTRARPQRVEAPAHTQAPPPQSKTPLLLGLAGAAVLVVGAYFLFSGKPPAAEPPGKAEVAVTPTPPPQPPAVTKKSVEPAKPQPKSVVVAKAPEPAIKPVATAPAPAMPVPAPVAPPTAKLPPELAALDAQFIQLQAERVAGPFATGLAQLNTGYLGGIARKIAEEKAAGHLDGILALEAEQKLLKAQQPVPAADDDKTLDSLKTLRSIYRAEHAKLIAARVENLAALTGPLDKRLEQMEADFIKADRLPDAKTVRGYREVLSESSLELQLVNTSQTPGAPTPSQSGLKPSTTLSPAVTLALKDGITNSLGMKFVPVPRTKVLFCIHETRHKDYAAFAAEVQGGNREWKNQDSDGFKLTDRPEDHPVIKVSWEDTQAFCAWLSKKEGRLYRLPTDEEWSDAVGLGSKEKRTKGTTPAMLSCKEKSEFPWGGDYPPKMKDRPENYSDESRQAKAPRDNLPYLQGYDDGHPTTAPVMSFAPNKYGLYDMGGNVAELCEDWLDSAQQERVLRGCSWYWCDRVRLLSSRRDSAPPNIRHYACGFRVVLVPGDTPAPTPQATASVVPKLPLVPPPTSPPATSATSAAPLNPVALLALKDGFTNSLGIQFVPVKGTDVLFCIHETR